MATGTRAYKTLAKRYLRTFPQNEFFEDDALAGYAYVKIVAEAIGRVGVDPQRIAADVHAHTFNIPGYAFPLRWTAWGELNRPTVQFAVLTRGPAPEARAQHAGDLVAAGAVQVTAADAVSSVVAEAEGCFSRSMKSRSASAVSRPSTASRSGSTTATSSPSSAPTGPARARF